MARNTVAHKFRLKELELLIPLKLPFFSIVRIAH
jgi:hypothetical protein